MIYRLCVLSVLFFWISIDTSAQVKKTFIEILQEKNSWVDSVFRKLSRRERIAQLFMIRAHTDKGTRFEDSVANIIRHEQIGGLVFFQGGPERQAALVNRYQSLAHVPLLIAMDGEWGIGMRLDSTVSYPFQMTLGAVRDNNLIYQMGQEVAKDFKRLGMQVNFAPDVDINNNPKNPVIGYRSFGDNKYNVAAKGGAYMKGMQDEGILISLKHFPGHGDTDVDSHLDLPQLPFSRERLDSLEMYPFRELIRQGASGVMVAHMNIPALDNTPNLPSTLSAPIVTGVLKNDLGFKGLVFSDAMEMKGVVKFYPNGEADVRGIIAGNDMIELSQNSERANKLIRKAIHQKRLTWTRVNQSVKKVLTAKYWTGLNNYQPVDTTGITAYLNRPEAQALNQRLADAALTLLKGANELKSLDLKEKTAIISLGVAEISPFQKDLSRSFPNSENFILSKIAGSGDISKMLQELKSYEQIIVAIHDYRPRPASVLDYNKELVACISELSKLNTSTILFANPYTILGLPGIEQSKTLLVAYQNSKEMQKAAAKVIIAQMKATGRLPVTVNTSFKTGDGIEFLPMAGK
jgi:beta-N-acetylhexosaminidase